MTKISAVLYFRYFSSSDWLCVSDCVCVCVFWPSYGNFMSLMTNLRTHTLISFLIFIFSIFFAEAGPGAWVFCSKLTSIRRGNSWHATAVFHYVSVECQNGFSNMTRCPHIPGPLLKTSTSPPNWYFWPYSLTFSFCGIAIIHNSWAHKNKWPA